jgi:hypothetical protein
VWTLFIAKSLAESNRGTICFAQTIARRNLGFSNSLNQTAGNKKRVN